MVACELDDDKRSKKTLLTDIILARCASSPHEILQKIDHIVNVSGDGSKLDATVLSGGYTNYSYKVFVDKHSELCVFAKLSFEYALWNPDRTAHYDLQRTANEYIIMETISGKAPGCVVAPLACWDIEHEGQNMKILLTEWSRADEQFVNQLIDGAVDPRIASKIADTLATLNTIEDFDENFNELVKPCMENLLDQMKNSAQEAVKSQNPKDRTEAYCASLGQEVMMNIISKSIADYHKRDCLIHSDAHALNILVEAKPSIEELEEFGPIGTMVLCDWEMAMAGPIGRDIGLALAYPVSSMIYHALSGHLNANESIEAFINTLIDTYCSRMVDAGKTPEDVAAILRNAVGWCGWFQYLAFYVLNLLDSFPAELEENKSFLKDALGVVGLKFMRLSYDTDHVTASTGVGEIRNVFDMLWREEVKRAHDVFVSRQKKMRARRSSVLRASGRRLSDTEMLYLAAESVKRLSSYEDAENMKREPSIAEDIVTKELSQ